MSLIGDVVGIVDGVAGNLGFKSKVTHRMFTGDAGKGDDAYKNVVRRAIVDKKQRQVRGFDGALVMSTTTVTFLDPAIVVGQFDLIVLDDGSGGPLVGVGGFIDGGTNRQAYAEAYLG